MRLALAAGAAALALGSAASGATTTGTTAYAAAGSSIPGGPTSTFTVAGPCQNFYTVPGGIYALRLVLVGGKGASGSDNRVSTTSGGSGGQGAQLVGTLRVQPGEQLNVNVGTNGSSPTTVQGQYTNFLGGAPGGIETIHAQSFGGQGGGASDIDNQLGCGNFQPSTVLAIAAGGGGGGGGGTFRDGGGGGTAGHDLDGRTGAMNGGNGRGRLFHGDGGGGATATAGGGGGGGGNDAGQPGGSLSGGAGGVRTRPVSSQLSFFDGGGGGAGGWYGGGGGGEGANGGGGGGGAGSSAILQGGSVESLAPTSNNPMVSITPLIVPPDAPTAVSAVAGSQQAAVSFTPPAIDGGSPVMFYTVTRYPDKLETRGTSSPITVKDLTQGTTYTFTVSATNLAGEGSQSQPSNGVVPYRRPQAPLVQSVTAGNGSATVVFGPSAVDQRQGNPITSYTATARLGVNVTSGPGITATSTSSPVTVRGLTNGQNYTVTVYATNLAGNGPESLPKVIFPETVPGAPTNLLATNATPPGATSGSVSVTLTPPADNGGVPIQSYTVTAQPGGVTTVSSATTVVVGGLQLGTSYTFTAHATNAAGSGSESTPSNAVVPTPVGIPSPPVVPGATPNDQMAFVSFLPPFDSGGSPVASYTVTSQPGGITATGGSSPILVMGLTNGTTYTFTVTATNTAGGTSQPSQATQPVTPRVPSGPAPANDNFANAQAISGASGSVSNTNVGATVEPGEPTIQDQAGGASVWYRWTAPTSGTVRFDTCTAYPAMDPNIEAFIGNSVGNITPWGPGPGRDCPANQFGSEVTFTVSANQTIYVKLDGVNFGGNGNPPSEGPFTLEWAMQ